MINDDEGIAKVNPAQVQKFLRGVDYPATKDDLIEYAQDKGADESVLETLRQLPDHAFQTPAELGVAIGELV